MFGIIIAFIAGCMQFLMFNFHTVNCKIVVIIPSYNNAHWCKGNLASVFMQTYDDYHIIFIDDASTDDTFEIACTYIDACNQEHRCTLIHNKIRRGALANLHDAIHQCDDWDIIVTLDGDDSLHNKQVLQTIHNAYQNNAIWLTHGRLIETHSGWTGWCLPIPNSIVNTNSFRTYRCPSHLRTFYAWLFKAIDRNDLIHNGLFFPMAWDQAMMFPMIEMAGERHLFMPEILYMYNTSNPINDNKVNRDLQTYLESVIRQKTPYKRLEQPKLSQHNLKLS